MCGFGISQLFVGCVTVVVGLLQIISIYLAIVLLDIRSFRQTVMLPYHGLK